MKLKTMLYGLTLMLGCFVFASCVNDEEGPCLPDSNGKMQVYFTLALPDNAQTRAWGDQDPNKWIEGENKDNDIEISSLKMLVFDNAGKFKALLSDLTYLPKEKESVPYEKTVYECVGILPNVFQPSENAEENKYKFVLFANCKDVPSSPKDLAALSSIAFNPEVTTFHTQANKNKIPMWGVLAAELEFKLGQRQNLGTLTLLRAMSKVTVALTPKKNQEGKMDGFDQISSVEVVNYNEEGFVVPDGYADVDNTISLAEECINDKPNSSQPENQFIIEGTPETKELTFYLLEYKNSAANEDNQVKLIVTLGKTKTNEDGTKTVGETRKFDFAPIKFCTYDDESGAPSGAPFDIVRNHYYKFNITEVVGGLYVVPTVANWNNAPELEYTINMSTNMRLFDSWLYRYDKDNQYGWDDPEKPEDVYSHWQGSHMVVSSGRQTLTTDAEPIAGRPLHSPQIQLLTTGAGTFELFVDNTDFEIVRANKNDVGVVTSYEASSNGTLTIASGEGVYTYFYIVPKIGVTPSNPVAKVFLYYKDPVTGKQEVPYNRSALPGYSDDSSEIWAYFVTPDKYNDEQGYMKMYYQDAAHPLVPVPTVNP